MRSERRAPPQRALSGRFWKLEGELDQYGSVARETLRGTVRRGTRRSGQKICGGDLGETRAVPIPWWGCAGRGASRCRSLGANRHLLQTRPPFAAVAYRQRRRALYAGSAGYRRGVWYLPDSIPPRGPGRTSVQRKPILWPGQFMFRPSGKAISSGFPCTTCLSATGRA